MASNQATYHVCFIISGIKAVDKNFIVKFNISLHEIIASPARPQGPLAVFVFGWIYMEVESRIIAEEYKFINAQKSIDPCRRSWLGIPIVNVKFQD